MADIQAAITRTGTIAPGGSSTELLRVSTAKNVCVVVQNNDPVNVLSVAVYRSPLGTAFGADVASSVSTVAALASTVLEFPCIGCQFLELVLSSSAGASYALELCGKGH